MYRPSQVPDNVGELSQFLTTELALIEQSQTNARDALYLRTQFAPPSRIEEGMIVLADGTTWNPGSGAGVYLRRGGAWRFLG
jgi:hypothetical protein